VINPVAQAFHPVLAQAKAPWPFWATPNHEITRGGERTAPKDGLER